MGNPLMDVDSASIIEERWPHFKKPSQIENKEVDALSKVFYVLWNMHRVWYNNGD